MQESTHVYVAELLNEEDTCVSHNDVLQRDDIRMLQFSQNRDFSHRCRGDAITVIVDLGFFEGYLFACSLVCALVD